MVTLHHFTDPLWLTDLGAWENPLVEDLFARFAGCVVEALGDQVTLWCTVNEPIVYAYSGFMGGEAFPPGANSLRRAFTVLRRMLLAHGRAYRTIHRLQTGARVGLAHHVRVFLPTNPASVADRRAAALLDRIANRNVYEAITGGKLLPPLGTGARATQLIDTCDFMGVNYYSPTRVAFDPTRPAELFARQSYAPGAELSDLMPNGEAYGEIEPHGLYLALMQAAAYGKPIYITENGVPDHDDDVRPRFIATHLAETRARSRTARTCAASTTGRWWTTSSGRPRGACASGCSSSTRRPASAPRAPAPRSTAGSRRRTACRSACWRRSRRGMAGSWKLEARSAWRMAGASTSAGRAVQFQFPVSNIQFAHSIPDMLYSVGRSDSVGPVAQLAEQRPFKPRVLGSIPNGLILP